MSLDRAPWVADTGWFCPRCGVVFRTNEPEYPRDFQSLPMTAQDVALGRVEKIGLVCPNGCQVGQWQPWREGLTDLSTPIYDQLAAEQGRGR